TMSARQRVLAVFVLSDRQRGCRWRPRRLREVARGAASVAARVRRVSDGRYEVFRISPRSASGDARIAHSREGSRMYKKILGPVDGSEASRRGLAEAIGLAKAHGASLRLVHVVNEYVLDSAYDPIGYSERLFES